MNKKQIIKVAVALGLGGIILWFMSKRGQQKSIGASQQGGEESSDQGGESLPECGGIFEDQTPYNSTGAVYISMVNYTNIGERTDLQNADPIESWYNGCSVVVTNACDGVNLFSIDLGVAFADMMNGQYSSVVTGSGVVEIDGGSYAYQKWRFTVPNADIPHGRYVIKWQSGANGIPKSNSAGIRNDGDLVVGNDFPTHYSGIMQPNILKVDTNALM